MCKNESDKMTLKHYRYRYQYEPSKISVQVKLLDADAVAVNFFGAAPDSAWIKEAKLLHNGHGLLALEQGNRHSCCEHPVLTC